jgi:hypothetical protein
MNLRFCIMVIRLFVLLFLSSSGGSIAMAQQDANNQDQSLMTPVTGAATSSMSKISSQNFIDNLDLKMYEAAAGDLSLCSGDQQCLKDAKEIKFWLCAYNVCAGTDKSKSPFDCSQGFADQYPKDVQDKISSSICRLTESPSAETRRELMVLIPNEPAEDLVEYGAYLLALKRSAVSCGDYIKDYIGSYGPQWEYKWYRAMSGCRILAGNSTRVLEEKNFVKWLGIVQGSGQCSDIYISDMRNACNTSGTKNFYYGQ